MHSPLSIDLTGYQYSSSAVNKLLQNIYRWKDLAIHDVGDGVLKQLAAQSFPILERLTLFGLFLNISFRGSAPMLQTVHIRYCRTQWSRQMLSNLRKFVLQDVSSGAPDIGSFLKLLSNSPKLTRLHVLNTNLKHSPSPKNRVPLLYLQQLEFINSGQDILMQLLGSITIPTSTTCRFWFALKHREKTPIYEQLEPIGQRLRTLEKFREEPGLS